LLVVDVHDNKVTTAALALMQLLSSLYILASLVSLPVP
jgi:hypothetical protein